MKEFVDLWTENGTQCFRTKEVQMEKQIYNKKVKRERKYVTPNDIHSLEIAIHRYTLLQWEKMKAKQFYSNIYGNFQMFNEIQQ